GGALPGVTAPPVSAAAAAGKASASATPNATITDLTPGRRPGPLLRATGPLSRLPAELADGLALKELRYGRQFAPIRPRDLPGPLGSSTPIRKPGRDSALLARQHTVRTCAIWDLSPARTGYHPPAALVLPRGFCAMKTFVANSA